MNQPTPPFIALAQGLVPSAQSAFAAQFDKQIIVTAKKVLDPETMRESVEFTFTPTTPGLLPTAIERAWFAAFVCGYQAATQNAVTILMDSAPPESDSN